MKLKQTIRTITLYVATVALVGGLPMTAYADTSDACVAANHKGKKWVTDPSTNQCVKAASLQASSTSTDPATDPDSTAPNSTPTSSASPTSTGTATDSSTQTQQPTNPTPDSTTVNGSTNASSTTNDTTNNTVTTGVDSKAASGNATVNGNQSAGGAGTGDASADMTVVNSVHSSVDGGTTGVAHFTANINGDVTGDITLAPAIDGATTDSTSSNSDTNVKNTTGLTNNVSLNADSGDATVRGNQSTGSATTGNANTVADILNLINTIIAANKSFVGTINIYGNLNGDILLSPEFIPQLLASNANASSNLTMPLSTDINDNNTIVNNVQLNATTGSAAVKGNDTTGSANTGTATTNLTILNLTGHQVNAANSLLVFVNVLGTWVGMIVDAPGATAAALGSGVVSDTTNISGQTNLDNSAIITNNINLASQSGNALVAGNGSGGSATSGNATASANIANISTSTFNLSGWFGVLYINVFGSWYGSFGVNTANGNVVPMSGMAVPPSNTQLAPLSLGFIPHAVNTSSTTTGFPTYGSGGTTGTNTQTPAATTARAELASAQLIKQASQPQTLIPLASPHPSQLFNILMMITGAISIVATYMFDLVHKRRQLV